MSLFTLRTKNNTVTVAKKNIVNFVSCSDVHDLTLRPAADTETIVLRLKTLTWDYVRTVLTLLGDGA